MFLNLDFIYYLIYIFFRSIFGPIFGFGSNALKDTDGDGIPDNIDADANGDGIIDAGKVDTDGDGIIDSADADANGDGIIDAGKVDTDGDGIIDSADADIDGDGILNNIDADANGDGIIDAGKVDTDGDGIIDSADADIDGDGIIDNGPDIDMDGIKDSFESAFSDSDINIVDLIHYLARDDYSIEGAGLGAHYDGYSLFSPPHGFDSWGDSFFNSISNWMSNFFTNPYCSGCDSFSDLIFGGWNLIFWLLSIVVIILYMFLKDKEKKLKELDWEKYEKVFSRDEVKIGNKKTQRWENILKLVESENSNDWRAAIIDADNLLNEVLIEHNYIGVNVGERLKHANFDSLDNAWEAHKIRNLIAHDSDFKLTKRDAKRAIQNYSLVFNEFYYL